MKKSTNNKTAAVSKTKDYTPSPPVRGRPVDYHKNVPTVRVDHLLLQKYDSKPLTRTKIKQQGKRAIEDASSQHAPIAVPKTVEVSKQVALGGRGFSTGWRDGKIPMPPMKAADRNKKEQINITGPIVTVDLDAKKISKINNNAMYYSGWSKDIKFFPSLEDDIRTEEKRNKEKERKAQKLKRKEEKAARRAAKKVAREARKAEKLKAKNISKLPAEKVLKDIKAIGGKSKKEPLKPIPNSKKTAAVQAAPKQTAANKTKAASAPKRASSNKTSPKKQQSKSASGKSNASKQLAKKPNSKPAAKPTAKKSTAQPTAKSADKPASKQPAKKR